ncbi:MAG: hypothetical protein QOI99_1777, partial [Actinomycetota bacterium]|nr:hypothetical protein [Actinomycetota bacterium]
MVDGSNLATEGRSLPSLAQLDEAVRAFREEHVDDDIIVVVDASFSYRIDESERQILEDAEEAGEIVSPPAGAIGRGDGFLLRIADRTGAVVLSNDSFQEFHGEYKWLFEEGRLIGGKPVPGVGWIFTPRTPVRGPKSRVAVRDAERARRRTTKKVEEPVAEAIAEATAEAIAPDAPGRTKRGRVRGPAPTSPEAVNEPLPFITFIANHRLGSEVEGVVDSFTSHGAFVNADGARCYAPVVGLGDPPPRSAKEVLTRGETRTFVVQALDPPRRGIELALPGLARLAGKVTQETVEAEIDEIEVTPPAPRPRPRRRSSATATPATAEAETAGTPGTMADAATAEAAPTAEAAGGTIEADPGEAPSKRSRTRAKAAPVDESAPAEGAAPAPAKRSRRSTSKVAAEEVPVAPLAAAEAEPVATSRVPAPAKASRRRTTKRAAVAEAEAVSAPDGSPAEGASDAGPTTAPTMRAASERATAAPADEASAADTAGPPTPATKRARRSPAPIPAPTPPVAGSAAEATRPPSGPRRSTIRKAASATGGPGRAAEGAG